MSEKTTLTKEELKEWKLLRDEAIKELTDVAIKAGLVKSPEKIKYFLEQGIARVFDQRHGEAAKKLALLETKEIPSLTELIPKGTEKTRLIEELIQKQNVLTGEMLKKLSIEQLRDLAEKF